MDPDPPWWNRLAPIPVRKAKHLPGLIQPVDYLATLWTHLTESLCQEVFEMTRAIEESGKGNPLFPEVAATPESFFQRIQSLRAIAAKIKGNLKASFPA
jgi:hypothetical protein